MDNCFVIQPFDDGKYDKRYNDIFKPAIENAGLLPYRIDKDPNVRIPIQDIEEGILNSELCFAEISTDNPNVWYELGFAIACGKDVVIVCSEERLKFPFDIQHRHIIKYKTGSISDFTNLALEITAKITALIKSDKKVKKLQEAPVVPTEGLKGHEIALMILIMQNQLTPDDTIALHIVQHEMKKAGYTEIATSIGIRTLVKAEMIETFQDSDFNGNIYFSCRLTDKGESWMISNQDKFEFRNESESDDASDSLPF